MQKTILCLSLAFLHVALTPYYVGVGDQVEQWPLIQRFANPGLYPADYFVNAGSGFGPRWYYSLMIGTLSRAAPLWLVLWGVWVAAHTAFALVLFHLVRTLTDSDRVALWTVVLWAALWPFLRFFVETYLPSNALVVPMVLTAPLHLAQWWRALKGDAVTVLWLAVPGLFLQPTDAVLLTGLAFGLALWVRHTQQECRGWRCLEPLPPLIGAVCTLALIVVCAWIVPFAMSGGFDYNLPEDVYLQAQWDLHPFHPGKQGLTEWLGGFGMVLAAVLLYRQLRDVQGAGPAAVLCLGLWLAAILGTLLAAESRYAFVFQPWKLIRWSMLWLLPLIAAWLVRIEDEEGEIARLKNLLWAFHPVSLAAWLGLAWIKRPWWRPLLVLSATLGFACLHLWLEWPSVVRDFMADGSIDDAHMHETAATWQVDPWNGAVSVACLSLGHLALTRWDRYFKPLSRSTRQCLQGAGLALAACLLALSVVVPSAFSNQVPRLSAWQHRTHIPYAKHIDLPALLSTAAHARNALPEDALVLVPPNWGAWRIHAERSIVYDGSTWLYRDELLAEWMERRDAVYGFYESGEPGLDALQARYGFTHAVLHRDGDWVLLPVPATNSLPI